MRGDKHLLALTTTVDEISGETKPLFGFPIQVCKATETKEPKFENAAPSGGSYTVMYRDDVTGQMFEYADRLRGVKNGDDFRPIDPAAIAAIDEATKTDTMVALGSMPLTDALAKYGDRITGSYYIQMPKEAGAASYYKLTYEALRAQKKGKKVEPAMCVVTKRTAKTRQQLGVLYADEDRKCLRMATLSFAASMREPDAQVLAPQTAEVQQAAVDKARTLIVGMTDGGQILDTEIDEAIPQREALIEQALAGEKIDVPTPVAETKATDDLMGALEASLAAASA